MRPDRRPSLDVPLRLADRAQSELPRRIERRSMEQETLGAAPVSATSIPAGTVAFLFTDIEGSTDRWERFPVAMRAAVREHDGILRAAAARFGGYVFKTIGDAFCVAFHTAEAAVGAALDAQRALAAADFTAVQAMRVRMAIHVGTTDERDGDYFGPPINRVARLVSIGHGGQILLSAAAAEVARATLPSGVALEDLGEHRLKDLTLAERVYALAAPGLARDFPRLRSLSVLRNNLPLQLGPLVGRDEMLRNVLEQLRTSRVLCLLGAGGVGKTRIAIQAAAELLEAMPDGVWFVDLAPLAGGEFVADTILASIEAPAGAGRGGAEAVAQYLRSRTVLIVLDNCEHVLDEVATIAAAVARASPDVKLLATSREPLGIAGENVLRVPSLDVPPGSGPIGADEALRYGAVALFVARAREADSRFALTDATAPAVVDIVRRLDGIALAIELAAARVAVLSVPHLARRLDERFRILTGGSRTAIPRQRTMHALIGWSWDLLDARERAIFRRLAVFAGGWTLEAVEDVCASEEFDALDVLDVLGSLVDKSLVQSEVGERGSRGRLLETIRAYALEKLEESGERDAVALRHALWVQGFGDRMHDAYDASETWLAEVEAELDNARAAMEYTLETGRPDIAARVVLRAFSGYWWYRAPHEGLGWAERTLARLERTKEPVLAAALHGLVGSYTAGRRSVDAYARAVEMLAPLVERGIEITKHTRLTYLLGGLGSALLLEGRVAEAEAALERALQLYRDAGITNNRGYANCLATMGSVRAAGGDLSAAHANFDEAYAIFLALDELPGSTIVLVNRAQVAFATGDFDTARALARRAAEINLELRLTVGAAQALADLAAYAFLAGELDEARRSAREALDRAAEARLEPPPSALLAAAAFAHKAGSAHQAARVLGYVNARETQDERKINAAAGALRAHVTAALERNAFRVAEDAGAGLSAEDVRAEASRALDPAG